MLLLCLITDAARLSVVEYSLCSTINYENVGRKCVTDVPVSYTHLVPGVDRTYFSRWFAAQTGDAFNFFDAFTGGSFLNMSLFALNITPYITSSIIIQLLTIAIPKLEEMQKDGEDGRKKLTAITRYVTVGLALIESTAMAIGFGRSGLLESFNALNVITVVAALTAGSAFLMWIGERITENGVGNGISICLLYTSNSDKHSECI